MISDTVREYKDIRGLLKYLLEGVVLSIDPSVGSTSSMPGWAVSRAGVLVDSGVLEIDATESLGHRLQTLSNHMRRLVNTYSPDLLLYEDIAPRRYGGGSAHGHASLLKSVGVVLGTVGPVEHLGLRPTIWTKSKRSSYIKGDEADAIEILYVALETARHIAENDPPRNYGGKSSGRKTKGTTSKTSRKSTRRKAEVPPY